MPHFASPINTATGNTRLQESLDRARSKLKPSVVVWLQLPGFTVAKLVGSLGADGVIIDCEHGNIGDESMYSSVAAIAASGASPIVRIPAGEYIPIKRALDAGAHALMVPMVNSREQAETVVKFVKYPSKQYPQGLRGAGTIIAHAMLERTPKSYVENANEQVLVIAQIETMEALENVEAIAMVDGIDMLFMGVGDLSLSMGHSPFESATNPAIPDASKRMLAACKDAGKMAGIIAFGSESAAEYWRQGFDLVTCGSDIMALTSGIGGELQRLGQVLEKGGDESEKADVA